MKKLIEGLPFYRDKLHEEGVFARFQEILVKVRRSKKKIAQLDQKKTDSLEQNREQARFRTKRV